MADEGGTRKPLIAAVVLLMAALVVVFVLWQRDRDSRDLRIDIGARDAGTVVEPGPAPARLPPEGVGLPGA